VVTAVKSGHRDLLALIGTRFKPLSIIFFVLGTGIDVGWALLPIALIVGSATLPLSLCNHEFYSPVTPEAFVPSAFLDLVCVLA